ncbi:MAG: tRNA (N(6)-L-threonylcarbamoyladenosine(37)-C(2))-methylthiotransferase MtaB [Candidatus Limisoma sp.]|nr:tRNA (N(6)-L-threonylcarbamoyladenosine(37)-C(2))-methylthiotransferase MtaB [Muribaculaceae bacterium]MDD6868261.1 tRNA (N(6)-L-threonylcarbamoyladenosine(37)-C(2))-methylthiotransferase MtaB [bacterium]MDY5827213.1 tRNA (N(6)-L-threonylcarbamoyladenosine(37)-C(2))-methylthiotransferase MtaB [Candidatus Limisoma sp.]
MIDENTFGNKKVLFHTLGCKLNFAESSTIGQLLAERGVQPCGKDETPDICVINTCTVTEAANKKCRQEIRKLARRYPKAVIVVTGCYAQLNSREVADIEGVDIVAGNDQKAEIADFIENWYNNQEKQVEITPLKDLRRFIPSCSRGDRTRYFLKVQDGCNYYCSYCTIPRARGRSRSGKIGSLVEQAAEAARHGGKEIVITGVNIGDFGNDTGEHFIELLRQLDKVEGIERYRISSLEPDLLTEEVIDFVAHSQKFMPHFHIPLQSGSDEMLKLMRRHYNRRLFADKVNEIKRRMPDAFIGVDLITGMRGETPEIFEDSRAFVESLDITRLHVFSYSERPDTMALKIPYVVPASTKHSRTRRMMALSDKKLASFTARYLGTTRKVLLEHAVDADGLMKGFTDNYLRVAVPAINDLANCIVDVRLIEPLGHDDLIKGEIIR